MLFRSQKQNRLVANTPTKSEAKTNARALNKANQRMSVVERMMIESKRRKMDSKLK